METFKSGQGPGDAETIVGSEFPSGTRGVEEITIFSSAESANRERLAAMGVGVAPDTSTENSSSPL